MKTPGSLVRAIEQIHPFLSPFLDSDDVLHNKIVPCKQGTMFLVVASDIVVEDIHTGVFLSWTMLWEFGSEVDGKVVDHVTVPGWRVLWLASRSIKLQDNPVLVEVDDYDATLEQRARK